MKKQIVFIEYIPSIPVFKIARTLRLTGKYETILVSFRKKNKKVFEKAYDKILVFDISHHISPKNLIDFFKKILSKEMRNFIKELKKLDPYIFQITGPELFAMLTMFIIKKETPKIFFAYDIWSFFRKKISLKNLGIKTFFQKKIEKIFFRKADGVLHKGPANEFKYLDYKINVPDMSFFPGCLDEWIIYSKKNQKNEGKNKQFHLAYAGGPLAMWAGRIPFIEATRAITNQKIYFDTLSRNCINKKDNKIFEKEDRNNKYFNFLDVKKSNFVKELSKYDYGIFPDFYDTSIISPLWPKTSMANKMFSYIEAGIPLIMNKQCGVMSDIIKENKIGILIDYLDLKNLKKIIQQQDYEKLQQNVKKAQEKFRLSKNIKKLEDFYEFVVNNLKK